jgi:8-oxo-dGTP pyrophosphatase MutT (NUDIX family)
MGAEATGLKDAEVERHLRHRAAWQEIEAYRPVDASQASVRLRFLAFLREHPNALERACVPGHLTASAFVVDGAEERALLLHHAKLGRWLQPGGHIENDAGLGQAALREVREETGLNDLVLHPQLIDLDIHRIPERLRKDGTLEPEHLHLDVRYLVIARAHEPLIESEESLGLGWFTQAAVQNLATDDSVRRLFERARRLRPTL